MISKNYGGLASIYPIWDVVVIGGGPAGAVAAFTASQHGFRTLLVDKQAFPRPKVCGGCVNGRALETLRQVGMIDALKDVPSVPIEQLSLWCGKRRAEVRLHGGLAISRSEMDQALVTAARTAGARWLPKTRAVVGPISRDGATRAVSLISAHYAGPPRVISAQVVMVADGLAGSSLSQCPEFVRHIDPGSRIGVGGTVHDDTHLIVPGTIYMGVASGGYVGLTRMEPNRINIAAALDTRRLPKEEGLAELLAEILDDAGLPALRLSDAIWKGTPRLTQRLERPVGERILVLGDSAGYVEPFTGEGMAWAIVSGAIAGSMVIEAGAGWSSQLEAAWCQAIKTHVRGHQSTCRVVARILRSPRWTAVATSVLSMVPQVATPLTTRVNCLSTEARELLGRVTPPVSMRLEAL